MIFKKIFFLILIFSLSCCSNSKKYNNINSNNHMIHLKENIEENIAMEDKFTQFHQIGLASWYGAKDGFHQKKTANGEIFDKMALTAAHRTLPMKTLVKVTNLANKKSVILTVNDRGPFIKTRIIDLSEKAADIIGIKHRGVAKVKIELMANQETN